MSLLNHSTVVLLICHVLGDFQFQSPEMAERKTKLIPVLIRHLFIHGVLLIVLPLLFFGRQAFPDFWGLILTVWVSHAVIDVMKSFLNQKNKISDEILYLADQLLHIILIILLSEFIFVQHASLLFVSRKLLDWLLLLLVITKPANISFKVVYQKYHFQTDAKSMPGAGAMIGNLERILSAVFLAMNQITAIGFIYTAKSIARFKEIEENRGFAEYYLIGTLFSILYVIVAYYLIIIV